MPQEHQAPRVSKEIPEPWDQLEMWANREQGAIRECKVRLDQRESVVAQDSLERLESLGLPVLLEHLDHLATRDSRVLKVSGEILDQLEVLAVLELQDHQGFQETQVLLVQMATQGALVQQELRDREVIMDSQVFKVQLEQLEQSDLQASLVLLVLLVPLAKLELLVLRARLVWRETLVRLVTQQMT